MRQLRRLYHVRIVSQLRLSLTTTNLRFGKIASELAKANPNTAEQIFDKHWQSWFTQDDVQRLKGLGINTVRIPVSLASLEAPRTCPDHVRLEDWLLARRTPRRSWGILPYGRNAPPCTSGHPLPGGAGHLYHSQREGLKWLKDAGIAVILDHHALPGVSSPGQMFAGRWVYTLDSKKIKA